MAIWTLSEHSVRMAIFKSLYLSQKAWLTPNLGILWISVWINSWLSHNSQTCTKSLSVWNQNHFQKCSNSDWPEKFKSAGRNSPLQKRESTGASFLYWLDWKSKNFSWMVRGWKATQPSLRVFSETLSKWEPCESCKIPHKPLQYFGLSTQSI